MGRHRDISHGYHCPDCGTLGYRKGSKRGVATFRCPVIGCMRHFSTKTAMKKPGSTSEFAIAGPVRIGRGLVYGAGIV